MWVAREIYMQLHFASMGFPTQKCTRTLKCQYDCTEMYYVLKYQCEFDCIQHRIPCIYVAFDCWLALFRYFIIFKMFASFLKLKQTPKIVQWKQLGTSQLSRIYTKSKITCPRNAFSFEISSMLQIKKICAKYKHLYLWVVQTKLFKFMRRSCQTCAFSFYTSQHEIITQCHLKTFTI